MKPFVVAASLALGLFLPTQNLSQEARPPAETVEPAMTLERMTQILTALDSELLRNGPSFQLTLADIPVLVITDPQADRMRAMVPIRAAEGLEPEELMRLMQANFDTALDARYAVAQGRLWGVLIHPPSPLQKDQLLSAFIQTINVARTYGQTYSGGALSFGGGDSNDIYRELLKELQELGEEI